MEVQDAEIRTVEGIAGSEGLTPLQRAFLQEASLQCGFCTPGFLVATQALLEANPDPTDEEIRFWLAGNLCRCTGYDKIVRAVRSAARHHAAGASADGNGAGSIPPAELDRARETAGARA
jgi:carbon-monoxide dehydrogenase small subunit